MVLTGFPQNSRRAHIVEFVKGRLKELDEWAMLTAFAPNLCGTIGMIKMNSSSQVFDFIDKWNRLELKYKEKTVKARAEKPPEKRKSNAKIYLMTEFLTKNAIEHEFEADFKHASVWVDDIGELVSWNVVEEFEWDNDVLTKAGITSLDKAKAEEHTKRK